MSWLDSCAAGKGERIGREETALDTYQGLWASLGNFGQTFLTNLEWKRTEKDKESSFAQQHPSQHKEVTLYGLVRKQSQQKAHLKAGES